MGVSVLLSEGTALLEAIAIATSSDKIYIFRPRSSRKLKSKPDPAATADAIAPLLRGERTILVGFGIARIAMHVRHGLNVHVRGVEVTDTSSPDDRKLSPGAFMKKYVYAEANTFAIDTLWDAVPSNLENEGSNLQHVALRAWLTMK